MIKKRFLPFLFLAVLLPLAAQEKEEETTLSARIEHVDSSEFPRLTAFVSVEDEGGEPNLSLVKGNFTAKIDTQDPVESLEVHQFKQMEELVHYVFFLSASGLMDGPPLAAQKTALLEFGLNLRAGDTLSAYVVGETPREIFSYAPMDAIPEESVQETGVSEDQAKIFDTLVSGVRKIEQDRAGELIGRKDRVVFILISDGRDSESRFSLEQTGKIMGDAGIPLYAVGLKVLSELSLSVLDELSLLSGGYYYYTPRSDLISGQLEKMAQQILMSYVISFKAKGVKADDEYHQLMIQVDEKELSLQAFRNFLAYRAPFPRWLKITLIILAVLLVVGIVLLVIFSRMKLRKKLGISKRRCPDCRRRMRDDWEFCPFCRYLDPKKNRKRKKEETA